MQGLYYDGKSARLQSELSVPEPKASESLIRISLAAICNTDREIMKGYKPDFSGVLGHEFVGVVEKSDDPELIGKRVVGEINEGCGDCVYCRTGREKHCESRKCIGIAKRDGCFAPYMTIATCSLHVVPDNVPDEHAAFAEPLAAALEIPDSVHIRPSEEICVIGDGRLSFLIAQVLALTGAEITVLGKHEDKLRRFEGFAKTATVCDRRYEMVVDAAGSPTGIENAMRLVRSRGTIVLKSTYAGNTETNLSSVVVNEVRILGSRCGPFEPALRLLSREILELPPIELYPIAEWEKAFASRAFKVGFDFRIGS
ncbi:MAG: alcohol dehydrogenase catalytic domain-containing protein [Oscillospiraceae bacterium]|nr:alcohol dehydrogenase catalytic domain-containing protein [Oscillospiraceae bacterium]